MVADLARGVTTVDLLSPVGWWHTCLTLARVLIKPAPFGISGLLRSAVPGVAVPEKPPYSSTMRLHNRNQPGSKTRKISIFFGADGDSGGLSKKGRPASSLLGRRLPRAPLFVTRQPQGILSKRDVHGISRLAPTARDPAGQFQEDSCVRFCQPAATTPLAIRQVQIPFRPSNRDRHHERSAKLPIRDSDSSTAIPTSRPAALKAGDPMARPGLPRAPARTASPSPMRENRSSGLMRGGYMALGDGNYGCQPHRPHLPTLLKR